MLNLTTAYRNTVSVKYTVYTVECYKIRSLVAHTVSWIPYPLHLNIENNNKTINENKKRCIYNKDET